MSRKPTTCIAAIVALGALVIAVSAWAQAPDERAAQGRRIAVARCGGCHAIGLKDVSRQPSAPPFRLLHERYPVEHLGEALAEGIDVGNPLMPVHVLAPEEVSELLAYLMTLEPKVAPEKRKS